MNEAPRPYSIYEDPKYQLFKKELKYAAYRTAANSVIAFVDHAPGHLFNPGEWPSVLSDASKYGRRFFSMTRLGKYLPDLTPDAGWKSVAVPEVLDPLTGGALSSHAFETVVQLYYDVDRLKRFGRVQWQLMRGVDHQQIRNYLMEASQNDRIFLELQPKRIEMTGKNMFRHFIAFPPLIT
jgi:hypothetical protein